MVRIYEEGAGQLVPRGYGPVGRARRPSNRVSPYNWLPYIRRYADEMRSVGMAQRGQLSIPRGPFIKNFGDKLAQDTGINSLSSIGNAGQRLYNWEKSALSRGLNWVAKRFKKGKRGQGLSIEDLDGPPRPPSRINFGGPKGPGLARPPKAGMKRVYNTTGHGGGRFSGKKRRKIASAAFRGVQLSREHTEEFSDAAAVYVGHNSHPLEDVLRSIGLSIARLVAKKWNQDFNNFESFINGDTSSADSSIKVTITYRATLGGVIQSHSFVQSNKSWYQLGDQLMHQIIQLIEIASPTYWQGEQIIFANDSGATGNAHNLLKMDFSALLIKINGFSCLKLQNRTVSTAADTEANEDMHNIANNPLTGKLYEGNGQVFEYKFNNDYTTATDIFKFNNTGYLEIGAVNSTLTDPMQKVLKRPPSYKFLKGMKNQMSIKVNPGEIKTSVVRESYTHTLNGWIKKLFNVIRASSHLGAVTPAMCGIGKAHVIGLSHMLYDANDPSISVYVQVDSTVSAICTHKKKAIAAPVFDRGIETVVLIE